jgi:hypothetical protein
MVSDPTPNSYSLIKNLEFNISPDISVPSLRDKRPELAFLNNLWGLVGKGLSYWPARLHKLAEFIPWNRFLGSINV